MKPLRHALNTLHAAVKRRTTDEQAISLLARAFEARERGNDDDTRQIIADLISNDASPFVPDDEDALRMMSVGSLRTVRNRYLSGLRTAAARGRPQREADEFGSPSTLIAYANRAGLDTAPFVARLEEAARRAASAGSTVRRAERGIPLSANEARQAEAFAPESTLSAYRRSRVGIVANSTDDPIDDVSTHHANLARIARGMPARG